MTAARPELQKLRTISLSESGKGTAEFFLLISPGKVEQVKFIKGDDELKSFTRNVCRRPISKMKFPPDTQVQVVRRGSRTLWEHVAGTVHAGAGAVGGGAVAGVSARGAHPATLDLR